MPIFHDPERSNGAPSPSKSTGSESGNIENISGCSGSEWRYHQLADIQMSEASSPDQQIYDRHHSSRLQANGLEVLIQSLKQREFPAWGSHNINLESKPEDYRAYQSSPSQPWTLELENNREDSPSKPARQDIFDERTSLAQPGEIERPRSALHSGDFREGAAQTEPPDFPRYGGLNSTTQDSPSFKRFGSSPTTPWFNPATPSRFISRDSETVTGNSQSISSARSRAPSLGSFSSSYVLKAPTSPLVYQANNTDLDFSPKLESVDFTTNSNKNSRRRTLPPETFMQLRNSPPSQSRNFNLSRSFATVQGGEGLRHQAYQPHRSPACSLQPASSPQTPFRLRRPSLSSDLSPRIHASMVGSYEESILRGRMSTTPSKPLDFTAKIGVLGKGKCKANLRYPPHVTVPFPAVFYSYPTSGAGRSISDDSPSPYVGLIDLENSLPRGDSSSGSNRNRNPKTSDLPGNNHSSTLIPSSDFSECHKHERRSGRTDVVKAPPGGAYRIPQRGQLQIVIKNPNKTAVKLFLVPYDLDGMEPGTKTFIRQRSYSAGPIIDMPLTARKNLGTDRPEASLNPTNDPKDKPTLRYLIHLNICCPAKGRFYLYSTIRVVFANRVPDGKEKLRNEIQYPEPRYSPYKPVKDTTNTAVHCSASDKHYRRRSAGIGLNGNQFLEDKAFPHSSPPVSSKTQVNPVSFKPSIPKPKGSLPAGDSVGSIFSSNFWQTENSASSQHPTSEDMSLDSSPSRPADSQYLGETEMDNGNDSELYNKLQKGDTGYWTGYPSSPAFSSPRESLLAQKLKEWNCSSEQADQ
ncbi:hypothetical protein UA08_00782 [Talaromyces atroroseus]|uniref:Atos-like conserved domain-containing protein n=1 Tax=Talaromyces atroroseus TaxID=1441469 RepID=A0A225B2X1_TALAT|nr:hypothetical protein UA08_00782 [Talaromyces atroroseus]OKL64068.1 hypothetical protein UA08_00782 [Talaromyces atroroseus]